MVRDFEERLPPIVAERLGRSLALPNSFSASFVERLWAWGDRIPRCDWPSHSLDRPIAQRIF